MAHYAVRESPPLRGEIPIGTSKNAVLPIMCGALLTDEDVRIARRSAEVHGTADAAAVEATRRLVVDRDAKDSRTTSFLTAADGVHTLDTTDVGFEQAVEAVLALVEGTTS